MGHAFGYHELDEFLRPLTPGKLQLIRPDLPHIYGILQRPSG